MVKRILLLLVLSGGVLFGQDESEYDYEYADYDNFYAQIYNKCPYVTEKFDFIEIYYHQYGKLRRMECRFDMLMPDGTYQTRATRIFLFDENPKWWKYFNVQTGKEWSIEFYEYDNRYPTRRRCYTETENVFIYNCVEGEHPPDINWAFRIGFKEPEDKFEPNWDQDYDDG